MLSALIGAGSSLLGGLFGRSEAKAQAKQQKEFAQNSIQWRVADAKKAGIHPLAALGASSSAYTPVSSGFGDSVSQAGNAIAQGVERRDAAKKSAPIDALNAQLIKSNIDTNQAQADLYRAQALSTAAQARNEAVGAVGGKTSAVQWGGMDVPYMPKTASANELEDKHGELGDMLAAVATINGIDPFKPNPFFYIKKKKVKQRSHKARNKAEDSFGPMP